MTEIIGIREQWSGKFLECVVIDYKNSRGGTVQWEAVRRLNCDGIVAVAPFTEDGEVILVKQFRPPVGKYVVEFPAGLRDREETLMETARRELLEETGYSAGRMIELAGGPLSAGASTEFLTVFAAYDVVYAGRQQLDPNEEIEIIKLPVEGFLEGVAALENADTLIDLKLYGLFVLAARRLE
jgi:8-oxo-dGTP pyrophosphatase MutT (NUDIX family)